MDSESPSFVVIASVGTPVRCKQATIDGSPAIDRIFLGEEEGAFVLAQWKLIPSNFSITGSTTGKKLAGALRKVALAAAEPVRHQIINLQRDLAAAEAEIAATEAEMNEHVYQLYGLTREKIALVEAGYRAGTNGN